MDSSNEYVDASESIESPEYSDLTLPSDVDYDESESIESPEYSELTTISVFTDVGSSEFEHQCVSFEQYFGLLSPIHRPEDESDNDLVELGNSFEQAHKDDSRSLPVRPEDMIFNRFASVGNVEPNWPVVYGDSIEDDLRIIRESLRNRNEQGSPAKQRCSSPIPQRPEFNYSPLGLRDSFPLASSSPFGSSLPNYPLPSCPPHLLSNNPNRAHGPRVIVKMTEELPNTAPLTTEKIQTFVFQ